MRISIHIHSHTYTHVCFYTVNVHIFAQLNFRASSIRRHIRAAKFSRIYQLILFVIIMIIVFTHIKFSQSKALREMHENMYCAKISTFTVRICIPRNIHVCICN